MNGLVHHGYMGDGGGGDVVGGGLDWGWGGGLVSLDLVIGGGPGFVMMR